MRVQRSFCFEVQGRKRPLPADLIIKPASRDIDEAATATVKVTVAPRLRKLLRALVNTMNRIIWISSSLQSRMPLP